MISFKIDWLDLIAVQGTFRGLLQHHSLKASVVATQRDNAESGVQFITPGPKAESPLSQGPLPVFVKTLYTLNVLAQTHLPKFLETTLDKLKERYDQS